MIDTSTLVLLGALGAIGSIIGGMATLIVGGAKALGYLRALVESRPPTALDLTISAEAHRVGDKALVSAQIHLRNVGRETVALSPVRVKQATCSARGFNGGEGAVIPWDRASPIAEGVRYLDEWYHEDPSEPMLYEPGSTDSYQVTFSTTYRGLLWIRAQITDDEDYMWRADKVVLLPEETRAA